MSKQLKQLLKQVMPADADWKVALLDNWDKIIGPIGADVTLLGINKNMVTLGVSHPAWVQELHLIKSTIKSEINRFLGHEYITEIAFNVVTKKKQRLKEYASPPQLFKKRMPSHRSLTATEERALKGVKQEDLKIALQRYLAYCRPKKS